MRRDGMSSVDSKKVSWENASRVRTPAGAASARWRARVPAVGRRMSLASIASPIVVAWTVSALRWMPGNEMREAVGDGDDRLFEVGRRSYRWRARGRARRPCCGPRWRVERVIQCRDRFSREVAHALSGGRRDGRMGDARVLLASLCRTGVQDRAQLALEFRWVEDTIPTAAPGDEPPGTARKCSVRLRHCATTPSRPRPGGRASGLSPPALVLLVESFHALPGTTTWATRPQRNARNCDAGE